MSWFANPPRFAPAKPKKSPFAPPNPFTGKPSADTMLAPPGWFDDPWEVEEKSKPVPPSQSDIRTDDEPVFVGKRDRSLEWNIALVSLLVYLAAGIYMRAGLNYALGDAMARTANARAMVSSRYPGLAPMGFVWMPLPTLLQVPFIIVLGWFGKASYAGVFEGAFCGAAAAYILVRTCKYWGLSDKLTTILVLVYALNPVVIFHQSNGNSEGVFFLCLAMILNGYLSWAHKPSNKSLLIIALALSMATIIRYEAIAFVPVVAVGVALQRRDRSRLNLMRGIRSAFVVGLPSLYAMFLWLLASRLVMGDAFFWSKQQNFMARPENHPAYFWLPKNPTLTSSFLYVAQWTVRIAPGLVVLVPFLLLWRKRAPSGSNWLPLFAGVFPVILIRLLMKEQTAGAARYFAPLLMTPLSVSIALLARRGRESITPSRFAGLGKAAVVLACAVGLVTTAMTFSDPKLTPIENENTVFRPALGLPQATLDAPTFFDTELDMWREATSKIDRMLDAHPDERIMIDMASGFRIFAFTKHPKQIMIQADLDWRPSLELFQDSKGPQMAFYFPAPPGAYVTEMQRALAGVPDSNWVETIHTPTGDIRRRGASPTPNAPSSP
jgi:hypothetical protein